MSGKSESRGRLRSRSDAHMQAPMGNMEKAPSTSALANEITHKEAPDSPSQSSKKSLKKKFSKASFMLNLSKKKGSSRDSPTSSEQDSTSEEESQSRTASRLYSDETSLSSPKGPRVSIDPTSNARGSQRSLSRSGTYDSSSGERKSVHSRREKPPAKPIVKSPSAPSEDHQRVVRGTVVSARTKSNEMPASVSRTPSSSQTPTAAPDSDATPPDSEEESGEDYTPPDSDEDDDEEHIITSPSRPSAPLTEEELARQHALEEAEREMLEDMRRAQEENDTSTSQKTTLPASTTLKPIPDSAPQANALEVAAVQAQHAAAEDAQKQKEIEALRQRALEEAEREMLEDMRRAQAEETRSTISTPPEAPTPPTQPKERPAPVKSPRTEPTEGLPFPLAVAVTSFKHDETHEELPTDLEEQRRRALEEAEREMMEDMRRAQEADRQAQPTLPTPPAIKRGRREKRNRSYSRRNPGENKDVDSVSPPTRHMPPTFYQNPDEPYFLPRRHRSDSLTLGSIHLAEFPTRQFNIMEKLGQGAYGWVYKALDKRTGDLVAIKAIPLETEQDEDSKKLATELHILSLLSEGPSIVSYLGSYLTEHELWVVLEFCDGGSVGELVTKSNLALNEAQLAACILPVVQALDHMHKRSIIHRDIKGENILVLSDGTVKVCDFGVACCSDLHSASHSGASADKNSKRNSVAGSPYWMAPELISGEIEPQASVDIWSLGITLIQLLDKVPPYYDYLPVRLFCLLTDEAEPPPHCKNAHKYSPEFNDFLRCCLQKNPANRLTAAELLQHPWLNGVCNEDLVLETYIEKALHRIEAGTVDDEEEEEDIMSQSQSKKSAYVVRKQESTRRDENEAIYTVKGMVALMRDKEKGLKLKTRHHFFKSYKKCFVGSDCVDWLMENMHEGSREQAVALGQMLMRRSIIRHVTNTHPFLDGNYFYRFTMDDKQHKKRLERKITPAEIQTLSKAMRDSNSGVRLKDRREFLHSYKGTFQGLEAKEWMVNHLPPKEKEFAEDFLQLLKEKGVFSPISKKSGSFRSDKELYTFNS